ncbi:hypothetical protein MMA231_04017 (plasmid) [Asticcacaulis sp. MM231]
MVSLVACVAFAAFASAAIPLAVAIMAKPDKQKASAKNELCQRVCLVAPFDNFIDLPHKIVRYFKTLRTLFLLDSSWTYKSAERKLRRFNVGTDGAVPDPC